MSNNEEKPWWQQHKKWLEELVAFEENLDNHDDNKIIAQVELLQQQNQQLQQKLEATWQTLLNIDSHNMEQQLDKEIAALKQQLELFAQYYNIGEQQLHWASSLLQDLQTYEQNLDKALEQENNKFRGYTNDLQKYHFSDLDNNLLVQLDSEIYELTETTKQSQRTKDKLGELERQLRNLAKNFREQLSSLDVVDILSKHQYN